MKKMKNRLSTELLILPDGQVLVHNLTQPMAEILRKLNPRDKTMAPRAVKTRIPAKAQHE